MKTNPHDIIFADPKIDYANGNPDLSAGGGLTKREYFAAQALAALLADSEFKGDHVGVALKAADELINALNENPFGSVKP